MARRLTPQGPSPASFPGASPDVPGGWIAGRGGDVRARRLRGPGLHARGGRRRGVLGGQAATIRPVVAVVAMSGGADDAVALDASTTPSSGCSGLRWTGKSGRNGPSM